MSLPTFEGGTGSVSISLPELGPGRLRYRGSLVERKAPAGPFCLPPGVRQRVAEFICANLESRLRVTAVAENFGFSASYFHRMFHRSFGETPSRYVMRHRLQLAQQLLTQTDLALVDIALKAGFSDQSHFSRRFRQHTGITPGSFRKQGR
jgi:AraC-like DNA-binding protein